MRFVAFFEVQTNGWNNLFNRQQILSSIILGGIVDANVDRKEDLVKAESFAFPPTVPGDSSADEDG
jgi:hypothetical protein